MNYSFNIKRFAKGLIPIDLRKSKFMSWINVLVHPLTLLGTDFSAFRSTIDRELSWSGQTISLLALLTDRFGPGITITNTNSPIAPLYMFSPKERKNEVFYGPADSRNPAMHEPSAYDLDSVDFMISVPAGIPFDKEEMKGLVRAHKLYSKAFKIVVV